MNKKLCALLLSLLPLGANATAINWTLQDVLVGAADNGVLSPVPLTGSFTYDADLNLYSNINITSQSGQGLVCFYTNNVPCNGFLLKPFAGASYNYAANASPASTAHSLVALDSTSFFDGITGDPLLYLLFADNLTNQGGTVQFAFGGVEYLCPDESCKFDLQSNLFREITYKDINGTPYFGRVVASVPEPSTFALFGLGIALLAFSRRFRSA